MSLLDEDGLLWGCLDCCLTVPCSSARRMRGLAGQPTSQGAGGFGSAALLSSRACFASVPWSPRRLTSRPGFDPHRPLYVTVVYQGKCSHCMRIGVAVPLSGTVARLREAVSVETKIPTDQVPRLLALLPAGSLPDAVRRTHRTGRSSAEGKQNQDPEEKMPKNLACLIELHVHP